MRQTSLRLSVIALILAASTHLQVFAACPCGYTVNSTSDPTFAIFSEAVETDFLHVGSLETDIQGQWVPQAFNVTPAEANGPYGKSAQVTNVIPNPALSKWNWNGPGIHGGDPGLQLWTRSNLIASPNSTGFMVPMAELVSARDDILYGTFRIGLKTTAVNGTCGAFFFYFSNSQEIDMELLSKDQSLPSTSSNNDSGFVNLVVQNAQSANVGYVNPDSADFAFASLPFAPQSGDNEFRFDWLPDRIEFYANGVQLKSITDNVPATPGAIHVNHWSNGNMGWSAGPPTQDAVMTVTYIKAYFNSSIGATTAKALKSCTAAASGQTCEIPTQTTPPDTSGPNGNSTGKTFFFDDAADAAYNPSAAATVKPGYTGVAKSGAAAMSSGRSLLLCTAVLGLFSML